MLERQRVDFFILSFRNLSIGQQFATIEALTMIAMILSKFSVELVEPNKLPAYGVSVTLPMLDGLPIRVHRRNAVKEE